MVDRGSEGDDVSVYFDLSASPVYECHVAYQHPPLSSLYTPGKDKVALHGCARTPSVQFQLRQMP
jgi:hypothetical protein